MKECIHMLDDVILYYMRLLICFLAINSLSVYNEKN